MNKVLVLAPHPDDEILGCGGALAEHNRIGDEIRILYATSNPVEREREAVSVAHKLQATVVFWREPDGALEICGRNVERFHEEVMGYEPDIIYIPHGHDGHVDHQAAHGIAFRAGMENCWEPFPDVREYEIWTPLRKVRLIVDITRHQAFKLKLLHMYESQFDGKRFPNHMDRAILSLNEYRAIVNGGQRYGIVEAFG